MDSFKVRFQPADLEIEVSEGSTVMEAMNETGLEFDFPCGGKGTCGKCRVRITEGLSLPTSREEKLLSLEEINQGIRLACQTEVHNPMFVELLNYKKLQHNILMTAEEMKYQVEPHLTKKFVKVAKPLLENPRSDWHRLKDSLREQGCPNCEQETSLRLLRQLPETLRQANHQITTVLYGARVLGIEPQDTTDQMYGMAFDIGTTTIVGYLLDLSSGKELTVVSTLNPQTKYGADVISRVNFAGQEDGLEKLHTAVIGAINQLIGAAAEKAQIARNQIYGVSIAANTCMHHLFMGISPKSIAVSPYVSAVSEPIQVNAHELNIEINAAGMVFVLPNIAGFVGADTTAVLLATELNQSDEVKLIIDIGTNGEIALGSKEKIFACSAAAGPAFEGAQISSGMRGAVGAIDHVQFNDQFEYSVIGGVKPVGICGSALLDTVAGMLELGIIDKRGKILGPEKLTNPVVLKFADHLVAHEGQNAFLLVDAKDSGQGRPIMVTQNDIRELQLAKGAMAAGVKVLLESYGIDVEDVKEVLLAGAFGNYLNPHSACVIGLIPLELESKIKMIGNAAGTGSKLALLSATEFAKTAKIAEAVEFVELGSYPKFNSIFAQSSYFKPRA